MRTALVVFTRDLRVHDHPALATACAEADAVAGVFVLDEAVLGLPIAAASKLVFLLESLGDLRAELEQRGGTLLVRRGEWVEQVARLAEQVRADAVHLSEDVSARAADRLVRLRRAVGVEVRTHPGITVVPPAQLRSSSGGAYAVFTPYWRRWREVGLRDVLAPPHTVPGPPGLAPGDLPELADLTDGAPAPHRIRGGERAGRERLDAWLGDGVADYEGMRDDLAADATSRLSAHLHLGTVSPLEVVARADRRRRGVEAFLRQLCWRDFHHQVLADAPAAAHDDWRTQGDAWDDDPAALAAWAQGRTGYPIVDAGMRQLAAQGWLHNRARLIVASFLVRHLYLDWRLGARHFLAHLIDGDVASNQLSWQWVAGTGTTSRPNTALNPLRQADRYDPHGDYVRRWVPELRGVPGPAVHRPWDLDEAARAGLGYPPPIVDHDEAMTRFRAARDLG